MFSSSPEPQENSQKTAGGRKEAPSGAASENGIADSVKSTDELSRIWLFLGRDREGTHISWATQNNTYA